jgi:Winged helix-turn helix
MPHETLGSTPNLRTAPPPRQRAPGAGVQSAPGRASGPGVRRIRLSVAPGRAAGRRGGLGSPAAPWPPAPVDRSAVHPAGRALAPGGHRPWLRQRAGDLTAARGGAPGALGGRSHPAHVWKRLRCLGWSCQGPERHANQRDEPAMAHWQRDNWPAIKTSPPPGSPPGLPG